MARKVFISYRRADTEVIAGRLRDRLLARLPKSHVFLDTGSIAGGELFGERIERAAKTFDTMVVMIGAGWLGRLDGGQTRIRQEADYVRLEVRTALARGDRMTILPVLVEAAQLPDREELPEDIRDLLMRNVMRLSNGAFDRDFESLFARTQGREPTTEPARGLPLLLGGIGGAVIGCIVALLAGILHMAIFGRSLAESLGGNDAAGLAIGAIVAACTFMGLRSGLRRRRRF